MRASLEADLHPCRRFAHEALGQDPLHVHERLPTWKGWCKAERQATHCTMPGSHAEGRSEEREQRTGDGVKNLSPELEDRADLLPAQRYVVTEAARPRHSTVVRDSVKPR